MQKAYLDTLSIDYFKNIEKFLLDIFSSTLENLRKSENFNTVFLKLDAVELLNVFVLL